MAEKKQILNRNTVYVPDENGRLAFQYTRLTKVGLDSGKFYVTVPSHIHNVAEIVQKEQERPSGGGTFTYKLHHIPFFRSEGEVVESTKGAAIEQWETLMHRCAEYLTNMKKEKVILLSSEMNVSLRRPDGTWLQRGDVSFAKVTPLVGVMYKVCFQIGKDLVNEGNRYVSRGNGVVVPWTAEREAFAARIVNMLEQAATQLDEFFSILKQDPLQIETAMKKGFLLEHKQGDGD
jgi:hypothetical protein